MTKVLVVEDDPLVASFLDKGLRASGYATEMADDGRFALELARQDGFDLVILDMGLPGADGMEVMRGIRKAGSTVPIIVLTGHSDRDVVTCLENGADDYMRKPFHFDELLARVRTRLRHDVSSSSRTLVVRDVRLDILTRRALVGSRVVDLTSREFALLETFMRHPDQVLSREQLLSQVWGYSFDSGTNLVNVYVNTLRNKLGAASIETVRGAGYRFPA